VCVGEGEGGLNLAQLVPGEGQGAQARLIPSPVHRISVAESPGNSVFFAPGSGIWIQDGKKYGSVIRDKHLGSYFRELSKNFLGYN
jgi:hypothetical protein